jgi:hypothetical protein
MESPADHWIPIRSGEACRPEASEPATPTISTPRSSPQRILCSWTILAPINRVLALSLDRTRGRTPWPRPRPGIREMGSGYAWRRRKDQAVASPPRPVVGAIQAARNLAAQVIWRQIGVSSRTSRVRRKKRKTFSFARKEAQPLCAVGDYFSLTMALVLIRWWEGIVSKKTLVGG